MGNMTFKRKERWHRIKPSEAQLFALRVWANELAEHYDLDSQWIEKILIKTVDRLQFESDHRPKYPGNLILKDFRPSLVSALEALPVKDVKQLFSQDDEHLFQIRANEKKWRDLLRSPIPVQTFERILYVADDFKKYLSESTQDVVRYGQPTKFFHGSEWLQRTFTDCWQAPNLKSGVLDDFDSEGEEIIPPPELPSFAEVMEKNSRLIKAPKFDPDMKYRTGPREGVLIPGFRAQVGLFTGRNRPPEHEDLKKKLLAARRTKDFVEKLKALRLGLHHFSEDSFSHLVHVLKNRKKQNGIILAEKLVAECWNSFTKYLNPSQIDVLTETNLTYFGLPPYSSAAAHWFYGGSIHKTVFVMANLMEKIISGKWDEKIQTPLAGISEYFIDDETGDERFRCSYFQARAVCGADKVDAALRAIDNLRHEFHNTEVQVTNDLKGTPTLTEDLNRAKEVAFLDSRAIERIKAMGGYVVFPDGNRIPTLKEIVEQNPRPVGMIDDCAAFVPKIGKPILFNGVKQRTVIRFLFSRCDSKPKHSATLDEIIREVCTEEEAKDILRRRKVDPDSWRLDRTWFDGHAAWKTVLKRVPRDEGVLVQKSVSYYLDLSYGNEKPTEPLPKAEKASEKQKHGPGITFSPKAKNNKNKEKKKAV